MAAQRTQHQWAFFLKSFHPFINILLDGKFIAILIYHSLANATSLHIHRISARLNSGQLMRYPPSPMALLRINELSENVFRIKNAKFPDSGVLALQNLFTKQLALPPINCLNLNKTRQNKLIFI
jgi:hypothetical protein